MMPLGYAAILSRSRWRRDEGASTVEFALIVPLLLAFLLGIIQFGFVFAQSASLANGARQGARYGVVNAVGSTRDCAGVVSEVRDGARTLGMAAAAVAVTVSRGVSRSAADASGPICQVATGVPMSGGTVAPCDGATVDDALYVRATYDARLEIIPPLGRTITLTGQGTYRCEYS